MMKFPRVPFEWAPGLKRFMHESLGFLAGPGLPCWPWAFWQVVRFLSAYLVLGFVAGVGFLACCCCCCCWVVLLLLLLLQGQQ